MSPRMLGWCGAVLFACAAVAVQAQERPAPPADAQLAAALEKAVTEAVSKAEASVVAIARIRNDGGGAVAPDRFDERPGLFPSPFGSGETDPASPDFLPQEYGTGVVIDGSGLIVTTQHVLGDPNKNDYYVWSQKRPFKAKVVPYKGKVLAADPWLDLAVLKIEGAELTPIKLGDAKQVKKGQFAIVLGNPFGIARDGQASAAWGVISNLNRPAPEAKERANLPIGRETLHHYGSLLQTDVRLERGTSGSALVNLQGELIGLVTALTPSYDVETSAGFAIPVDQAFKDAIEKLKTGRKVDYGFLGVAPKHLSVEERQLGRRGAKVLQVVAGTPAADLNLAEENGPSGDVDTITHVDGQEVEDANNLIMQLSRMPAGATVRLTVQRADRNDPSRARTLDKQVTLAKKYMDTRRPVYATVAEPSWRGLTVDYATASPSFRERLSFLDPAGCVVVLEVERNSPAWKGGLRPGMFISHLGDTRVATPAAFLEAAEKLRGAAKLRLTEQIAGENVITIGS